MRVLICFGIMLLSVSLQSTVIPALSIGGIRPDLVLVVVISAALTGGRETGVLCGAFGGILQDLLSAGPFGVNTLSKILLGLVIGFYERKVNQGNFLLPIVAIVAGTMASTAISALFLLAYGLAGSIPALLIQMIPTTAYHILLAVPVRAAMLWLKRRQTSNLRG
jgi:rod shape-determining protein MreD